MHLIIALSRTDDVKSVGLLRLQHLFYFFTPYWADQHVSISPSLHPIRITAQSSPEQNSLRHIPETSTLPKASHTKMKPQSGSTGLSQLFRTSVVRASLSLFFLLLLPFQELWWNGCCDRNTTKTKAFPSVFSERINSKICYNWTNVKLKTAIYTLKIQVWDTLFFLLLYTCL